MPSCPGKSWDIPFSLRSWGSHGFVFVPRSGIGFPLGLFSTYSCSQYAFLGCAS